MKKKRIILGQDLGKRETKRRIMEEIKDALEADRYFININFKRSNVIYSRNISRKFSILDMFTAFVKERDMAIELFTNWLAQYKPKKKWYEFWK